MTSDVVTIAILDDRIPIRETLRDGILPALPVGWDCIICPLLEDIRSYPKWLLNNEVCILLLDQRLNEQSAESERPVSYRGDDVMKVIRAELPDFPIIVVAGNVTTDDELLAAFGYSDNMVERNLLVENIEQWVPRFERLARAFSTRNAEQLARLGQLSERAALGQATEDDLKDLKAIQQAMSLSGSDLQLDVSLNELDDKLAELQALEQYLRNKMQSQ